MQLLRLEVENFMKIVAVELEFDAGGELVVINGRNAQGKSSLQLALNALFGGKAAIPKVDEPIRRGAKKATIVGETDEWIATRTFTPSGNTIKITTKRGAPIASTQGLLDKILSDYTFDPGRFLRLKVAEQISTYLEAAGLSAPLARINMARADAFADRTHANRELKALEARLAPFDPPDDALPDDEIDATALVERISGYTDLVGKHKRLCMDAETDDNHAKVAREEAARLDREIERLQKARSEAIATGLDHAARSLKRNAEADTLDVERIAQELIADKKMLESLSATNAKIREARAYRALKAEVETAEGRVASLEATMRECDENKAALLDSAPTLVEGLVVTEEEITLDGFALAQASTAQQIKVAVRLAIAMHPELRVIRIAEASFLDSETREMLDGLARSEGFVIMVEAGSDKPTGDRFEIFLEEGRQVRAESAS